MNTCLFRLVLNCGKAVDYLDSFQINEEIFSAIETSYKQGIKKSHTFRACDFFLIELFQKQ